mgnify:CR=1 FL=1
MKQYFSVALLHVAQVVLGTGLPTIQMVKSVIPNLVSGCHNFSEYFRMFPDIVSNTKERRSGIMPPQCIQHKLGRS